jgi:predicted esterase
MPMALALFGCGQGGGRKDNQDAVVQKDVDEKATVQKDAGRPGAAPIRVVLGPDGRPLPPLELAVPPPLPAMVDGMDLKAMSAGDLIGEADDAMAKAEWGRAAAYQYWYVQKSKRGRYNLARDGKVDPAFYWLQAAALEDGVDAQHAQRDEDLVLLMRDPRWRQVHNFLVGCNRYFESTPIRQTLLVLPTGYKKENPIPAILWLHGLGSGPGDFANPGAQRYADKLHVAIVGVSGTKARGPRSFVWAENPEVDSKRMKDALAEVSDRVTIKKGHIVTFGFSQGAQVGLDVAVREPETYAGSIFLSPGAEPHLIGLTPSPLLAGRGFVVSCGAEERYGNVRLTADDAEWLQKAKAKVIHKAYPGERMHAFPVDFNERFPEWVSFILDSRKD